MSGRTFQELITLNWVNLDICGVEIDKHFSNIKTKIAKKKQNPLTTAEMDLLFTREFGDLGRAWGNDLRSYYARHFRLSLLKTRFFPKEHTPRKFEFFVF